eukprot:TRINITY_DN21676_c0_g1_i1.p1 TRINITY_DN21676_c0_g1~~TRINITY_DN21676_c0_g1_i1.p1  ORF type:complete len:1529 (+),score=327.82 TRINITY_DN21676_c0_g1_i1:63-4649(+)
MFLSRIGELKLLDIPEDENILKPFDENVKRAVARQIMPNDRSLTVIADSLVTPMHIIWLMEALGQGFLLPLHDKEDCILLDNIFSFYQIWLLSPEKRPKGFQQQEQHFIRKIVLQFSLLFEPRKEEEAELEVRCIQCRKCLKEVFLGSAKSLGQSFQRETWDCYLKILLGVVDQILTGNPVIMKKLGSIAIRVLFEVWIMAGTTDNQLWNSLYEISRKSEWVAKTSITISHWVSITLALTKLTINLMYPGVYGRLNSLKISYTGDEKKEEGKYEISVENVFFYWHRFLHLLGNPNNIAAPSSFSLAMSGISSLVDCYLSISKHENLSSLQKPPPINKILDIFGGWIFEAMLLDKPSYEEGTSTATATICKILCEAVNPEPIHARYLATFYTCASKILTKKSRESVVYALLTNSKKLFLRNLPGSTVLIPCYFSAIARIWSEGYSSLNAEYSVGVSCADILTSLAPFPNRYPNGKIIALVPDELLVVDSKMKLPPIHAFSDLFYHYRVMIKQALAAENNEHTLQRLLWCFSLVTTEICWHYKNKKFLYLPKEETSWVSEVVGIILAKFASHVWIASAQLLFKAFEVLAYLRLECVSQIKHSEKISEKVLKSLITFIMDRVTINDNDLEQQQLVASAYQCIRDWLVYDDKSLLWLFPAPVPVEKSNTPGTIPTNTPTSPSLLQSVSVKNVNPASPPPTNVQNAPPSLKSELVKAIMVGLESNQTVRMNASQQCLNFLLNCTDSDSSCLSDETDLLYEVSKIEGNPTKDPAELFNRYRNYIQWIGLDDKYIVSIMDNPFTKKNGPPSVIMIVRNEFGKSMWRADLQLFANPKEETPDPVIRPIIAPSSKPVVSYNFKESQNQDEFEKWISNYSKKKPISLFNESFLQQAQKEYEYLKGTQFGLESDISFKVPNLNSSNSCKFVNSRIFMSHLGWTIPKNTHRVSLLEQNPRLLHSLKQIDSFPEREPKVASVIYVKKDQKSIEDIFSNTEYEASTDFKSFLTSLGWLVQPHKHTAYKYEDKGFVNITQAPYYADQLSEYYFLVSIFMGKQFNQQYSESIKLDQSNTTPRSLNDSENTSSPSPLLPKLSVSTTTSPNAPTSLPPPPLGLPPPLPANPKTRRAEKQPSAGTSTPQPTDKEKEKSDKIEKVPGKKDSSNTSSPALKPIANQKASDLKLHQKESDSLTGRKTTTKKQLERAVTAREPTEIKTTVYEYKRSQLLSTRIAIIWVEDELDYNEELILQNSKESTIVILIMPLSSGLYSVRIRSPYQTEGSLIDFTILPKHQLGFQIRRFVNIASCWISTDFSNGYWREPQFLLRSKKIQGLLRSYSRDLELRQFYASQFKLDSKLNFGSNVQKEGDLSFDFRLKPNFTGNQARAAESEEKNKKAKKFHKAVTTKSKRDKKRTNEEKNKAVRWSQRKSANVPPLSSVPKTNKKMKSARGGRTASMLLKTEKEKEKEKETGTKGQGLSTPHQMGLQSSTLQTSPPPAPPTTTPVVTINATETKGDKVGKTDRKQDQSRKGLAEKLKGILF